MLGQNTTEERKIRMIKIHNEKGIRIDKWAESHGLTVHVFRETVREHIPERTTPGSEMFAYTNLKERWVALLAAPTATEKECLALWLNREGPNCLMGAAMNYDYSEKKSPKQLKMDTIVRLVEKYNIAEFVTIDGEQVEVPFLTAEGVDL